MATTTYTWIDGTSGDWGTPADWSPAGVPDATSDASFVGSGAETVTVSSDEAVNQLTLDNAGTTLVVQDNATLSVYGGLAFTAGTLNLMGVSGQATVDVLAPAGFGTPGVLAGNITLGYYAQPSNALLEFSSGQITDIAQYGSLILYGPNALVADAGSLSSNSALQGLSTVEGTFDLLGGGTLQTTGSLTNSGIFWADVDYFNNSSSGTVTIGGTVTNSGAFSVGDGTTVAASGFDNIGNLQVASSFGEQAKLDISAAAGFGTTGVVTGHVQLEGSAVVEFASGQITDIASGASLEVGSPDAFVQDASSPGSNSALQGLSAIEGTLALFGATVQTTGDLANSGSLTLQNGNLSIGGTLTNRGAITDGGQAPGGTISAAGLDNQNTGTIVVAGAPGQLAALDISGAATNDGTLTAQFATVDLQGPVSGSGTATIDYGSSIEFGSSVASTESVVFNSDGSFAHTLVIDQPGQFSGVISGFGTSSLGDDIIELANVQAVSATPTGFSDGVTTLEVKDAGAKVIATLKLSGDYTGYTFDVANGSSDSGITTNAAPPQDTTSPNLVSLDRADPAGPTNAGQVLYSVTFSEPVKGVDATQFRIDPTSTVGGASIAAVTAIDAAHYSVAVNTGSGDGTVGIDLVGTGIYDLAGNPLAGGQFKPQIALATGAAPTFSVISDINGDGKADIVVSDLNAGTISVRLGNGDGTFQSDHQYAASAYSVAVGDLNGDGKADLVTADPSGGGSVLLGNGDGTFQSQLHFAGGGNNEIVAIGDLNNDGKADLILADNWGGVATLLGNGDGTFQPYTEIATGGLTTSVAVGDLNGDGKLDIVSSNFGSGDIAVLLGNGDGTFQAQAHYGSGNQPNGVHLADLNGDGHLDSVFVNEGSGTVSVLLGNGDGTFQAEANYAAGAGARWVSIADLNGDGKLDLAVANQGSNNVSVLFGNGDGTFQSPVNYAAGTQPFGIAAGDLDGDGRADLVVANLGGNSVSLLFNTPPAIPGPAYAIDKTAPAVTESLANDTGVSSTDKLTKSDALSGTGDPNAVVHFTVDGTPIAQTATADASGIWTFTPAGLADGSHTIVASETDAAGNTGSASVTFTLDTTDPAVTGIAQANAALTNASTVDYIVTFSEAVTGVDASQFAVDPTSSVSGASIAGITAIDASHYKVTVSTGTGDGTVALDVIGAGIHDLAGNPLEGGKLVPQGTYGTGAGPISVAIGDVNGDGKPDLVVANGNSFSTASVLLGNGDGTFQPQITVNTGTSHQVVLGDVNGDGKLDIVSANSHDGTVAVLLGNGDGTFQPKTDYAAGANAISVAVADVNGDGKLDIATANYGANTDSILLGNGDGTFQPQIAYATGVQPGITVVADVNGDGRPDLITINQVSNTVSVLLGNGDGTFQPQTTYATQSGPADVSVADVNGDGKLDLVTANTAAKTVSVLLGNGDGTFQPQTAYAVGDSPYSLAIGDINGDGKPDIAATALNANTFSVLMGNGDGTFQPQVTYATGVEPLWVAIGDVSGDGRPDLVVTNGGSNNVSVFLNSPPAIAGPAYAIDKTAPAVTESLANDTGVSSTDKLTKSDALSGTGDPNAVVHFTVDGSPVAQTATADASGAWAFTPPALADGSHTIVASETDAAGNTGTASLTFDLDTTDPVASSIAQIDAATTNASTVHYTVTFSEAVTGVDASQFTLVTSAGVSGAGIVEVTPVPGGGGAAYSMTVNTGTGDGTVGLDFVGAGVTDLAGNPVPGGTFQPPVTHAVPAGAIRIGSGDFNSDGKLDLLTHNTAGTFSLLLGNGDGTFQSPSTFNVGQTTSGFTVGDLNNDGKLDVAVTNADANGQVIVALGNGDGTFQTPASYATGAFGYPSTPAIADLNNDGKPDLLVTNNNYYGGVSVLLGNGDGTFQPQTDYPAGLSPTGLAVGDLNGDGKLDVAVASYFDNRISILMGDGTGALQPSINLTTAPGPEGISLVDLNGDGKLDLVASSYNSPAVSVFLGNGDGTFQTRQDYTVPNGSAAGVQVSDVNGDGKLDLVVSDESGDTSLLLGNGNGTFQSATSVNFGPNVQGDFVLGDFNGDGHPDIAASLHNSNAIAVLLNTPPAVPGPSYTIDKTAPAVTESLANDTGVSSTDKLTRNDALSGTGDPNAVVHFTVDGSPVTQTATADASGAWTFTPAGLADGSHTVVASETDAAGNTGTASLTFALDTHGPTGWTFTLASSNFDGSNSIASGTVIGSVGPTGDPNSSSFTYFFASNQSGAGATQNLNGLSINASTGAITTTAALSSWPTAWVVAEDQAGNIFAKQLVLSFGTSSANTINVAAGTAAIFALGGSDTITGTPGNDGIAAGTGNDTIVGFVGTDTVNGGAGTDTISLAATSADLNAASDAQIVNVETISAAQAASGVIIDLHNQTEGFTINGSASGDVIIGTAAADTINAGAGNDTIMGFVGADTVHGGTGTDTIALTATSTSLNSASDTQIVSVETVSAAAAASGVSINLHNQSEGFTIVGSSSADVMVGTSAKDTIDGGAGADTLTGGAGKDVFVFVNKLNSLVSAYDTITDFTHGSDLLEIGHTVSASNFSALSHASTGNLLADLNATLTTANLKNNGADLVTLTGTGADAGTYVIVNSGHGSGYLATADAVIKLQAGATVTAADFIA